MLRVRKESKFVPVWFGHHPLTVQTYQPAVEYHRNGISFSSGLIQVLSYHLVPHQVPQVAGRMRMSRTYSVQPSATATATATTTARRSVAMMMGYMLE